MIFICLQIFFIIFPLFSPCFLIRVISALYFSSKIEIEQDDLAIQRISDITKIYSGMLLWQFGEKEEKSRQVYHTI